MQKRAICLIVASAIPASCFSSSGTAKNQRSCSRLQYSRSICTFDATDFPEEWPYNDETDFGRLDNTEDTVFYSQPRFVTHIDDRAIESLTEYYRDTFAEMSEKKKLQGSSGGDGKKKKKRNMETQPLDILDLCSSWISHLPEPSSSLKYGRVAGIGMNQDELSKNEQLTEFYARDLNQNPSFSEYLEDDSFDVVTNVVSIDYLTKPVEVMQEMYRVLRPGGVALISFSNRCFATKAVSMWLRGDDVDRLGIVASYFHFSNDGWTDIEALDIKLPPVKMPERPGWGEIMQDYTKAFAWASTAGAVTKTNSGDPMFVVKAVKPL